MSEITKRGPKVSKYEVRRLPTRNIDCGRNAMKVSDICNLPSLHEVRYEREMATAVYISLFIHTREGLMGPRGAEDDVWGCEAAVKA